MFRFLGAVFIVMVVIEIESSRVESSVAVRMEMWHVTHEDRNEIDGYGHDKIQCSVGLSSITGTLTVVVAVMATAPATAAAFKPLTFASRLCRPSNCLSTRCERNKCTRCERPNIESNRRHFPFSLDSQLTVRRAHKMCYCMSARARATESKQ